MLDALIPAREALQRGESMNNAAKAAVSGAHATAEIRARHGRSSYVGERAIGTPDPGAMGMAILFWAALEAESPGRKDRQGLMDLVSNR